MITEKQYEKNVHKAKQYYDRILELEKKVNHFWILIAEIAYNTCEPFNGGSFKDFKGYTYKKFAEDVGISAFALRNHVKGYKDIYLKASVTKKGKKSPDKLPKETISAIRKVMKGSKSGLSSEKIDTLITKEKKKTKEDKALTLAVQKIEGVRNLIQDCALELLDEGELFKIYHACEAIMLELECLAQYEAIKEGK